MGTANDIHPPLYYYILHFWMLAAGQTEFAVRSLSVITGVLLVALLFVLGRRLFGVRAACFAAVAGAGSPLAIYYSQETRMYEQVTLFGLLSTYLLWKALNPRSGNRYWVGYAVAALACVYSQYVGAFVLLFQGMFVLLFYRRRLMPFVVAGAVIVLGYLPWLNVAKESLAIWPSTSAFASGPGVFGDAAFRFVEGVSAGLSPVTVALTVIVVLIAASGLLARWNWSRRLLVGSGGALGSTDLTLSCAASGRGLGEGNSGPISAVALALLYVAVPIAAMFLLGYRKPLYNPKFALVALPGFLLLVGLGLSRLARWRWPALLVVLLAGGYALNNYYFDPTFARDDYRGVADFISTSQRPGDAIILNAPGQEQIFPYYYHGGLPIVDLPKDRPPNPDKTGAELTTLNGQYRRLWLVLYGTNGSDPDGYVEHWLAGRDYEIQNSWFGDVRLTAFAVPAVGQAPDQPYDATLGNFAHLTAYGFTPNPVKSGDVLQLGLRWKPSATASANDKVFTHVIDNEGNIWAQRDSDPVGGARPTTSWKPGEIIDDNYGLMILPGTPPGDYQIEMGMYGAADGRRLPVTAGAQGDRLLLAGLRVGAPPSRPHWRNCAFPSLKRLGSTASNYLAMD